MSVNAQKAAEELLKRRKAREELLPFVEYTHPRWQSGEHHRLICNALERVERGELKRLMIFAPPRHSKSELASRRFPAWYFGRNPSHQIICASHTELLASDIGADIREIVSDTYYKKVFKGVELNTDAKAAGRWRTNQGGICISVGAKSAVSGRGADVAILDDIVKGRNAAESPNERRIVWNWYIGDVYQRLQPNGAIVFMTTRWHEDDPAGRALKTEDWEVINLQAITDEGKGEIVRNKRGEAVGHTEEKALWPEWWPIEELRHKRKVFTDASRSRDWQAQYQQNPTPEEGHTCKRIWFEQRYVKTPEYLRVYMSADFAVTAQQEAKDPDRTEIGVFGVGSDGMLYALDWYSGQVGPEVWIEKLLDLVHEWKPVTVFSEAGIIRRATEPFLTKRMNERRTFANFVWTSHMTDKTARGRAFQTWAANGRFRLPQGPFWAEEFIHEVCLVPAGRYWDKYDTVTNLFLGLEDLQGAEIPLPEEDEEEYADYADAGLPISSWKVL